MAHHGEQPGIDSGLEHGSHGEQVLLKREQQQRRYGMLQDFLKAQHNMAQSGIRKLRG